MATKTFISDGTAHREAKNIYVSDGTAWRDIKKAWVSDGTAWRLVFDPVVPPGSVSYTTPGTYSWIVPDRVYSINIAGSGGAGGGGGGDAGANYNGPGSGGGGANIISMTYSVTPGTILNIIVGAGGAGGPVGGDGYDGTPTTVSGQGVTFVTGAGTHGGGYYTGRERGIGANGANNGSIPNGGTSTNGGANGGNGGGYYQVGRAGQSGKVTISWGQ